MASRFLTRGVRFLSAEKDVDYSGLFYHQFKTSEGKEFTVMSFISREEVLKRSDQTLHPDQIIGRLLADPPAKLQSKLVKDTHFEENPNFFKILHSTLKQHADTADPQLVASGEFLKQGWLHIPDQRNLPPFGRSPHPEDIFGSVLVTNGKMDKLTYQSMPTHRPLTGQFGLFQLSEGFHNHLMSNLLSLGSKD